jgi:hypothetical protein
MRRPTTATNRRVHGVPAPPHHEPLTSNLMTPVEQAATLRRNAGANFTDELEAHLLNGFVFSTPIAFLMGRPVPKGVEIRSVWDTWPKAECNAWFVWLAVGDAWRLMDLMPYELPWVGWARQGRGWRNIRWLPSALVRSRLQRFRS